MTVINGKWIAAGLVIAALLVTVGGGLYDRQPVGNGNSWYLVKKFTGAAVYACDIGGCIDLRNLRGNNP